MKNILIILFLLISSVCYSQVRQSFGAVADNLDSLYTHVGKQNQYVLVLGRDHAYDSLGGVYAYDTASTATEIPNIIFKVIGKDTGRWKAVYFFNAGRFGIDDNVGLQDRIMDMQGYNFDILGEDGYFNITKGTYDDGDGDFSQLYIQKNQAYLTSQSDVGLLYAEMYAENDGSVHLVSTHIGSPGSFAKLELRPESAIVNINSAAMSFPKPAVGDYYIPLSVNGNYADSTGNITVSGGGGSGIGAVYAGAGLTKDNDSTLSLTSPVTIAHGGTNNASLSVTNQNLIIADGSKLIGLAKGTNGQHLIVNGSGNLAWVDTTAAGGGGTVTSIATTSPITGGTITNTGTIALDTTTASGGWHSTNYYNTVYVPLTRTLSINGTSFDLSANRTWTVTANTTNALTMNNGGAGDASGTTFDGSAARTLSYNTLGAVPTTRTVNGKALSSNITLGLASSDFANQGTTTTVLHGNAGGNPSFGAVDLAADVTGTLPLGNGGTGFSTYTKGDIIYASATNTLSKLGIGTTGQPLTVSSSGVPGWGTYASYDSVLVSRSSLGAFSVTATNIRNSIGFRGVNPTAATATVVQNSPVFELEGQGWNTADATSNPSIFAMYVTPLIANTGAASGYANGTLSILGRATNGGAGYNTVFTINNSGTATISNNLTVSGALNAGTIQTSNVNSGVQIFAGGAVSSMATYRTTNGGGNVTPYIITNRANANGDPLLIWDKTNGLGFGFANDAATKISIESVKMYLTDIVSTNGSESSSLEFATQRSAGAAASGSMKLTAAGNLSITNGNLILATAGNGITITEGTDGRLGQTTLVAGVKAITINGLTTSSRAFYTFVSVGGTVTTTWQYKLVCTSNTLTITAIDNTGATNTLDTSVLNYTVFN